MRKSMIFICFIVLLISFVGCGKEQSFEVVDEASQIKSNSEGVDFEGSVSFDGETVSFNRIYDDANNEKERRMYYKDEQLQFVSWDKNNDGMKDFWIRMVDGEYADLQMEDTDFDGKVDIVTKFDSEGRIIQ
ncbi:hypothetical protein J0B03_05360 [Alkalibacter rhizosphaerae]|uniref:Lipoprotein n=1 Tax=Alkalibacter rhizosphaerae TaxID=2815577 RepID=A0A974XGQ5_9FIRM|nr:hypothetical protein [Alkalibacter rhizosphaerae]QSX09493.1 hypothetical protein J0B03_05360 [Alkalibacter rhizosphaerae]